MRGIFDRIISEGEAGVDRLIAERTQENVQLDFKLKRDAKHGRFDDEDKKVYGKALSAFANSSGGLLIWGVDARKGPDQIDCAQGPGQPIADIERFRSEAIRFAGDLLIPRHDGIHIEAIPSTVVAGSGYLLVYVERSERRPHRCEAKGEKQYFKRAGDSSFAMEHYDIEDAFHRTTNPKIELGVRFLTGALNGNGNIMYGNIEIYIDNNSAVSAKMPYLQIKNVSGASFNDRLPYIIASSEGEWFNLSGDASTIVHPGISRTLARFRIDFDWNAGCKIQGLPSSLWSFTVECRYGCENMASKTKEFKLEEGDIIRMIKIR